MNNTDLVVQERVVDDWATELVAAMLRDDMQRAAVAAATIHAATEAILDTLDPQRQVSPAITHVNGHYHRPGQVTP